MLESEKTTLFILKVSTKPTGSSSFIIEAFANDNDTKGSGDIKGWMEVISSSGEFRYGLCEMK